MHGDRHWDHELGRSTADLSLLTSTPTRFMGSLHLLSHRHWDQEPGCRTVDLSLLTSPPTRCMERRARLRRNPGAKVKNNFVDVGLWPCLKAIGFSFWSNWNG